MEIMTMKTVVSLGGTHNQRSKGITAYETVLEMKNASSTTTTQASSHLGWMKLVGGPLGL